MKRPRDITAAQLIANLRRLGYEPTRQVGSHLRLTTNTEGQHHVTLAVHKNRPIPIGKLGALVWELARHFGKSRDEIAFLIFG